MRTLPVCQMFYIGSAGGTIGSTRMTLCITLLYALVFFHLETAAGRGKY